MNWNEIQNFSSNIVFGILLFALIAYWVNLALFRNSNLLAKIGRFSTIIANGLLFCILGSRWIVAGYFPLSNLYESLLFLTCMLLTIYLYIETKTKSKLIGSVLIPVTLLINGFANLTLSPEMHKSSPFFVKHELVVQIPRQYRISTFEFLICIFHIRAFRFIARTLVIR